MGVEMARINIEDDIWLEAMPYVAKVGDVDKAMGNLLRFMKFAQEKFKHGLVVTELDFTQQNFLPELKLHFAQKVDGGGYMMLGAEKHFSWLKSKVENGVKGGLKRSEAKKAAAKARQDAKRVIIDETPQATTSESRRPQASSSSSSSKKKRNTCHSDISESHDSTTRQTSLTEEVGHPEDLMRWWNEVADPTLARIIDLTPSRISKARARLKQYPDEAIWVQAMEKINASKFCLGKVPIKGVRTKPWKATFDWLMKPDTITKILEGQYDNK